MNNLISMKNRTITYIVSCLIAFSGTFNSYVLCFGADEHMHIEATFNGVDCGHFAPSPLQTNIRQHLTDDAPFATTSCYACTDIPLASLQHLLQQNRDNTYSQNEKTAITITAIAFSSLPFILQGLHPARGLMLPIQCYCTLSQILSSPLRI
jgi:hypothetical protein